MGRGIPLTLLAAWTVAACVTTAAPPSVTPASVAPPSPPAVSATPPATTAGTPTPFVPLSPTDPTALDGSRAWVASALGLLRTEDGGATWTRIGPVLPTVLRDLEFVSPSRGWLTSAEIGCTAAMACNTVFRSDDAGASWRAVYTATDMISWTQFTGPADGWIIANERGCSAADCGATLLRTTDAGGTWQRLSSGEFASARFTSPTHGWLVARTGPGVLTGPWSIRATDDGGATWREELALPRTAWPPLIASAGRSAWVLSSEPDTCNAVGCEGWLLWRTQDLGRTWTLIQRPTHRSGDDVWWAVPRPTAGLGFLVQPSFGSERFGIIPITPSGAPAAAGVLITTDAGATWRRATDPRLTVSGVRCGKLRIGGCAVAVGDGVAWLALGSGSLVRTADAGATWQQQLPDNLR